MISAFQGLSFSLKHLYDQIAQQGWEVKKLSFDKSNNRYLCELKSPHGEKLSGWGPNERHAISNALYAAMNRNQMRMGKVSMWGSTFTSQLTEIAEAYSKAPLYEPKAAIAFMELARDAEQRFKTLGEHLEVVVVNNPEPYPNAEKMCDDIRQRRKLQVSSAGAEHPIWSVDQVIAFRASFDVLGYCASSGDWGWEGTNQAFAAYAAILPVEAQDALFSEIIGQTAYATYYRAYGPQKIALFPEFMDAAKQKENPHQGYRGLHPSQSLAPLPDPEVKKPSFVSSYMGLDGLIKTASAPGTDPNEGWESGVAPLPQNARLDNGDPLQYQASMHNAGLINTEWAYFNQNDPQDLHQMRLAIENAFKVVLLSPRKDLRWNAIHYQDISDMHTDDPTDLWHRLEERRQNWNVQRHGEEARYAHMPYFKQWKALEQLMYQKNPQAGWQAAQDKASAFLMRMQTRLQNQVMQEDEEMPEEKQRDMYKVELETNRRLTAELKQYISQHQMGFDIEARAVKDPNAPVTDPAKEKLLKQPYQGPVDTMFDTPQVEVPDKSKYGAWMGTHLQAVAQISEHVDEILKAALFDVHERDGSGHHFRSTVLSLNVSGVGPKVCSFAWLLLQPLTSQLATIDTHMMDVLGHDFEKDMSPRDYFKFERELAAGRDAAGYGDMPLGAFQWSMWDYKRTGPGTHQDHSAMKVLKPLPHDQIDWESKQPMAKGGNWTPPGWWGATQAARDAVAARFDQTVGENVPADQIPYNSGVPASVYGKVAQSLLRPWFVHPDTGERIVGQPGQTIMQHAQSIGLNVADAWRRLAEVGKE